MKIKAFTITELVVALAISAVVSSIGYYAFTTIGKTVKLKNSELTNIEKLEELRFLIKYDMMSNHDWVVANGNLVSESSQLTYQFGEKEISRILNEKSETFYYDKVELEQPFEDRGSLTLTLTQLNKTFQFYIQLENHLNLESTMD